MKQFKNKSISKFLTFYVFFFLISFIFTTSELLNRKVNRRNKFYSKSFSKAKTLGKSYSADLEIIIESYPKPLTNEYEVTIEFETLFEKSGIFFTLEKLKTETQKLPNFIYDSKHFFIKYRDMKNISLQTIKNEEENKLEIDVDKYKFIFNFGRHMNMFAQVFDNQELKDKFISKIKQNKDDFMEKQSKFKGELMNTYASLLSEEENYAKDQ